MHYFYLAFRKKNIKKNLASSSPPSSDENLDKVNPAIIEFKVATNSNKNLFFQVLKNYSPTRLLRALIILCLITIFFLVIQSSSLAIKELHDKKENQLTDISPPLGEKLRISGGFGEFRHDHFHLGLDFRVDGKIGLPVLSPKDGKFYSLGFEKIGYGLYLTIRHLDGSYSLFAHLDNITEVFWQLADLKDYKKKFQKEKDFFIKLKDAGPLIKTGEQVAFTGETGNGPPHLHYEYKDPTGRPINPFASCCLKIQDRAPPVFTRLFVLAHDENSGLSDKQKVFEITPLRSSRAKFFIKQKVAAFGKVKFKVAGFDNANTDNILNYKSLTLWIDNKKEYAVEFNQIDPGTKHRMGLVYDAENSSFSGITYVYRLYSEMAHALANQQGTGILTLDKAGKKNYNIKIIAEDFFKNQSQLSFRVKSFVSDDAAQRNGSKASDLNLFPDQEKKLSILKGLAELRFPAKTVLTPTQVNFNPLFQGPELPEGMEALYPLYEITPRDQYVENPFKFKIPIPLSEKNFVLKKIGIYQIFERNNQVHLLKNLERENDSETMEIRQFGLFGILRDNSPPQWLGPHFNPNSVYTLEDFTPGIYVKDTGLGIDPSSVKVYLNNKKVIAHYNPNRKWIFIDHDFTALTGKRNTILASVQDLAGNRARDFQVSFRLKKTPGPGEKIEQIIVRQDNETNFFDKKINLTESNTLTSVDQALTLDFPARSIRSESYAKKISVKRLNLKATPENMRWNLRGDYLYRIYIPDNGLKKGYQLNLKYENASGDKKSSIVKIQGKKIIYIKNSFQIGSSSFHSQELKKGGVFGLYFDDAPPQWGTSEFREKKIYERYNIPLAVYLFDDGLGIDPASIRANIDKDDVPVKFDKKQNKIIILADRQKLKKGFSRLRIRANDYAGNPASPFSRYFIIRYKPKWIWN